LISPAPEKKEWEGDRAMEPRISEAEENRE
jgi:hypothetical protein